LFNALSEKGVSTLYHPRFGDIDVIPSSWSQSENLVNSLGRADFKIEFIKINKKTRFPSTTKAIDGEIVVTSSSAISKSIDNSGDILAVNSKDYSKLKEFSTSSIDSFFSNFQEVLNASQDSLSNAILVSNEIVNNIDVLMSDPINLYSKISNLISIPAQIAIKCSQKIISYLNHVKSISEFVPESYAQARACIEQLFYCLGFSSQASTVGTFTSRSEVISSSDYYGETLSIFFSKIESVEASVAGFSAKVDTISDISNSVSISRDALIDRAFSLKSEKRITLKSNRTPIDLVYELTGSISGVEELISSNKLSGNEIVLIPQGKQILYYE